MTPAQSNGRDSSGIRRDRGQKSHYSAHHTKRSRRQFAERNNLADARESASSQHLATRSANCRLILQWMIYDAARTFLRGLVKHVARDSVNMLIQHSHFVSSASIVARLFAPALMNSISNFLYNNFLFQRGTHFSFINLKNKHADCRVVCVCTS